MSKYSATDLVVCESADGWSLHAPGVSDEQIASGEAPYLVSGEYVEDVLERDNDGEVVRSCMVIPDSAYDEALSLLDGEDHHIISTTKGSYAGTLLACLEWQATMQGAMPDVDGEDISDLSIASADDPYREDDDLTPDEAEIIVRERLRA